MPAKGSDCRLRPGMSVGESRGHSNADVVVLVLITAFAYLVVPASIPLAGDEPRADVPSWYCRLAKSFLRGQVWIADTSPSPPELIRAGEPNRWYVGYPPVPAVFLMPFTFLMGPGASVKWFVRVLGILNVAIFDWMLRGAANNLQIGPLRRRSRLLYGLLFSVGTTAWHIAIAGGDWHWAHTVATTCVLLGLGEYFRGGRLWLVGVFVALAGGSRPPAGLGAAAFVGALLVVRLWRAGLVRRTYRDLGLFAIGPALMLVVLGFYNHARFGDITDFGYTRMVLDGEPKEAIERYGQFHTHFVRENLYWFFIAGPLWLASFPWAAFDPKGMGLLWTTPAMLYALVADPRRTVVRCVWIGIVASLPPLLLYYNTGFAQFGHRFGMDYLPLAMILILAGMGTSPSLPARILIGASMVMQAWGAVVWLRYMPF